MRRIYRQSERERACELVEGFILSHHLAPGDRLPSERDLCHEWGLNRTTLRSALSYLSSLGVVEGRLGSGTYVAQSKLRRNLQDTLGFTQAAELNGLTVRARVLSAEQREADKSITHRLHIRLGSPVYVLRRLRLLDDVPTAIETVLANADLMPGLIDHDFSTESLYEVMKSVYGYVPSKGEERLSVTQVDEDEALALNVAVGTPAFFQSGVVCDKEGMPLEYFKGVILSERVQYCCELVAERSNRE